MVRNEQRRLKHSYLRNAPKVCVTLLYPHQNRALCPGGGFKRSRHRNLKDKRIWCLDEEAGDGASQVGEDKDAEITIILKNVGDCRYKEQTASWDIIVLEVKYSIENNSFRTCTKITEDIRVIWRCYCLPSVAFCILSTIKMYRTCLFTEVKRVIDVS